jgi:hypothetical protein
MSSTSAPSETSIPVATSTQDEEEIVVEETPISLSTPQKTATDATLPSNLLTGRIVDDASLPTEEGKMRLPSIIAPIVLVLLAAGAGIGLSLSLRARKRRK